MIVFEIIGTIAFAVAGALTGIQKRLDIFGVIILAVITAVGGGIFRDVLIGHTPPQAFRNSDFLFLSVITALAVSFFHRDIKRYTHAIQISDAVGLGAFAAAGANIALQFETNTLFIMVVLAVTTGVGGGVIRDVLVKEIPFVFRRDIYAVAALLGAVGFYLSLPFAPQPVPMYICFVVTTVIRLVSLKYDFHLPVVR